MSSDRTVIESLKAVDAWIDVINANINGGVRTAYKSSRLKFGGSNATVARVGNLRTTPLQFPEPGLTTVNTVVDWGQGAVIGSTEITHLAIQGQGFFVLNNVAGTGTDLFTRDGEFHTDTLGYLVHGSALYLYDAASNELVWDDSKGGTPPNTYDVLLSSFTAAGGGSLVTVVDPQQMQYTLYGSTVYNYAGATTGLGTLAGASILTKSLEASNASMTQSVPELSLAQKLFSALTKVLQIGQTNIDAVLNLVR
ncbi:MAG: hypothetical protein H7338_21920 [Candidatus Sericytochromatia bacterium]|nr:hypothetical protein [Candidatus Sericytochromatia bacterium]